MADLRIKLKEFQTGTPFPLQSRVPDTYNRGLLVEGNSLISTVYVESMDPGATLTVNFWEYTTGSDLGERREIKSHPVITAPGETPHLLIVAPFHNAPQVECVVANGNVNFSVMLTCVSSFASAQDNSLVLDGTTFDPNVNLGQPIVCLDETTNQLMFLRCRNGVFPADPIYNGDPFNITGTDTLVAGTTQTLESFTVSATKRLLSRVTISTFLAGRWFLEAGSSLIASGRLGPGSYTDTLDFTPREEIANGTLVELKYSSVSGQADSDVDYQILGSDT